MQALSKSTRAKTRSSFAKPQFKKSSPGNRATNMLPRFLGNCWQAKFSDNSGRDVHEREADSVAAAVTGGRTGNLAGQRYANKSTIGMREPDVSSGTVQTVLGSGRSLSEQEQHYFKSRLGQDFNSVRIHTGPAADNAARSLNARAFTLGNQVVFANGEYQPQSSSGKHLLAHELTHVVQQRRGVQQIQRQPRTGSATSDRRSSTYYFSGCDDTQMEIFDRTIRQAYLMVQRAQVVLTDYLLAGAVAESPEYNTSLNYEMLRRLLRSEFGASTPAQVREIKWKFLMMEYKMRRGLEIECHNDPARNQIAEAEVPGRRMWFGPLFFNTFTDELHSRPRVFIHELTHNVGIGHDMVGLSITAGSDVVDAAEFAFHADAFATLATRLYTGRLWQRLERNSDI